jgi:hypothetical protein
LLVLQETCKTPLDLQHVLSPRMPHPITLPWASQPSSENFTKPLFTCSQEDSILLRWSLTCFAVYEQEQSMLLLMATKHVKHNLKSAILLKDTYLCCAQGSVQQCKSSLQCRLAYQGKARFWDHMPLEKGTGGKPQEQ